MSCPEFPKIETLFERDESFKVDEGRVRRPEFLIPRSWVVTEKIDGTNVRVSLELDESKCYDGSLPSPHDYSDCQQWKVIFYGRTENSQMPTFLLDHLQRTFTLEKMQSLWRCKSSCDKCDGHGVIPGQLGGFTCEAFKSYPIVLYGEGYGARIQKGGGNYRRDGDVSFRLFDALIGERWLSRTNVEDIAQQLGIEAVPLESPPGGLPLDFIVAQVQSGIDSHVAHFEGVSGTKAEGVVAFTDPPLFNSRGQRLIWKLKSKDFMAGKR